MALTKTIIKETVTESSGNKNIQLKITIFDNSEEVASKIFEVDYKEGTNLTEKVQELKAAMQEYADEVTANRTLFNNGILDTAVTWLNSNVTVG